MTPKFTFTEDGVAAVLLLSLGSNFSVDDRDKVSALLKNSFNSGVGVGLKKAKELHRETNGGGCRILTLGDSCDCFLCQADRLIKELKS